jgi:hypothetical protein
MAFSDFFRDSARRYAFKIFKLKNLFCSVNRRTFAPNKARTFLVFEPHQKRSRLFMSFKPSLDESRLLSGIFCFKKEAFTISDMGFSVAEKVRISDK